MNRQSGIWSLVQNGRMLALIAVLLILAGGLTLRSSLRKEVTLMDAGEPQKHRTDARTVAEALSQAGVAIGAADRVLPALDQPFENGTVIIVERAHPVLIAADGQAQTLLTTEKKVANLLAMAGVSLFPGDDVRVDGVPVSRSGFSARRFGGQPAGGQGGARSSHHAGGNSGRFSRLRQRLVLPYGKRGSRCMKRIGLSRRSIHPLRSRLRRL